ncbi:MAG: DUF177 domain-containing protein [Candidatus Eisenbacteria bacterium]|uniref:DUF177 domain-containing protein n=1 Tax=Eiseniibacteriota bacterium TaxID=2212470 RepID=A0A538U8W7_UNCEI|nr:MAG: DUF177 domain-containing protein [Candidatus Eisenbacteria bacterium]
MSAFVINLATLHPGRNRVEARAEATALDLPGAEWPGVVHGTFDIDRSGNQVALKGRLTTVARLECVRCLRSFDQPVEAELTVLADRSGSGRGLEEDLERDHYMKFHDGRQLDVRDDAREALLLELPMTPHCSEVCKGLCPTCGADLNLGPCEHQAMR